MKDPWLQKVFDCLAGAIPPEQLVAEAGSDEERRCEAFYYAGERCRVDGRTTGARRWLEECVGAGLILDPNTWPPDPMNEWELARWRLKTLWPDDPGVPSAEPG